MDKNVAGLIGAVGALVATVPAQAAVVHPVTLQEAMQAGSYADLLKPIPNATALLKVAAASPVGTEGQPTNEGAVRVERVQYYQQHHHHHHHHHHHSQDGGYRGYRG